MGTLRYLADFTRNGATCNNAEFFKWTTAVLTIFLLELFAVQNEMKEKFMSSEVSGGLVSAAV